MECFCNTICSNMNTIIQSCSMKRIQLQSTDHLKRGTNIQTKTICHIIANHSNIVSNDECWQSETYSVIRSYPFGLVPVHTIPFCLKCMLWCQPLDINLFLTIFTFYLVYFLTNKLVIYIILFLHDEKRIIQYMQFL